MIAVGWGGCASEKSAKVDDSKIARLNPAAKQDIIEAENKVNVARSNVTTLQSNVDESKKFQGVAEQQIQAAKHNEAAADEADKLAQRTGGVLAQAKAAQMKRRSTAEMAAAKARKEFADKTVDLRNTQLDEAKTRVGAAQAEVEQTKMITARANGQTVSNADEIQKATREANGKVADAHQKTAQAQAVADVSRQNWEQKQMEFNLASAQPVIQPPAPAPVLPPPAEHPAENPAEHP